MASSFSDVNANVFLWFSDLWLKYSYFIQLSVQKKMKLEEKQVI